MSAWRALTATVHDSLVNDVCLFPLLDTEKEVTHGTAAWCDEPTNRHRLPAVRRSKMGWPGHFERAAITFSVEGKGPFQGGTNRRNVEDWVVKINIFTRSPVVLDDGSPGGEGDLLAGEIYEHVVRILGHDQSAPVDQACGPEYILYIRRHAGDSFPLDWVVDRQWWQIGTRFVWTVQSRGLIAPVPCIPCGTL